MESEYWLIRLRTSKKYLAFLVCQCLLSLLIIFVGILNDEHLKHPLVLVLEYVLSAAIALDMYSTYFLRVIRYKTEPDFFKRNHNLFDVFLLTVIMVLLISITVMHQSGYIIGLEADDIIALSVLVARYSSSQGRYIVQIIRLAFLVKKSHENLQVQREMKQIEMADVNHVGDTLDSENNEKLKQHIIRGLSPSKGLQQKEYPTPDISDERPPEQFKHERFRDQQEI